MQKFDVSFIGHDPLIWPNVPPPQDGLIPSSPKGWCAMGRCLGRQARGQQQSSGVGGRRSRGGGHQIAGAPRGPAIPWGPVIQWNSLGNKLFFLYYFSQLFNLFWNRLIKWVKTHSVCKTSVRSKEKGEIRIEVAQWKISRYLVGPLLGKFHWEQLVRTKWTQPYYSRFSIWSLAFLQQLKVQFEKYQQLSFVKAKT